MSSLIGKLFHFRPRFFEEIKFKKQKKKNNFKKNNQELVNKIYKEDTEK